MNNIIEEKLNPIFAAYEENEATRDFHDEIYANLLERSAELTAAGQSPEAVVEEAFQSMGELTEVLDEISQKKSSGQAFNPPQKGLPLANEEVFEPAEIAEVIVSYQKDSLELGSSSDGKIHLLEYMHSSNSSYFANCHLAGGKLIITGGVRNVFTAFKRVKLLLLLPENADFNVELSLYSGNLRVSKLSLNALSLECRSGNVKLEKSEFNSLTADLQSGNADFSAVKVEGTFQAKVKSGNLKVSEIQAGKAELENKSGNLHLERAELGNLQVYVKSGNIKVLSTKLGEGEIEAGSGNVHVEIPEFKSLEVSSRSGEVKVLTSRQAEFTYKLSSDSGNAKLDLMNFSPQTSSQSYKEGQVGEGSEASLLAKTRSGNVKLSNNL